MESIGVVGLGRLGICWALNLLQAGYNVYGVENNKSLLNQLGNGTFQSSEPGVTELYIENFKNFKLSASVVDIIPYVKQIFILVPTPSNADGSFDHSSIVGILQQIHENAAENLNLDIIISSTVMPNFCNSVTASLAQKGLALVYNPQFIAQGKIIADQLNPDFVLIGSENVSSINKLMDIYNNVCRIPLHFKIMSYLEAEITKLALNCFLTTKITFANLIGDIAIKLGTKPDSILNAIGADRRVGPYCMNYGFGFGGPCFPRDNQALQSVIDNCSLESKLPQAVSEFNQKHLSHLVRFFEGQQNSPDNVEKDPELDSLKRAVCFNYVTYKKESTSIENSQQLVFASLLADSNYEVTIKERSEVIEQVRYKYGDIFKYEERG